MKMHCEKSRYSGCLPFSLLPWVLRESNNRQIHGCDHGTFCFTMQVATELMIQYWLFNFVLMFSRLIRM